MWRAESAARARAGRGACGQGRVGAGAGAWVHRGWCRYPISINTQGTRIAHLLGRQRRYDR